MKTASVILRGMGLGLLTVSLLMCASCSSTPRPPVEAVRPSSIAPAVPVDYRVGVGDTLAVKVWRNDDLNRNVQVDPSGCIDLPLAGQVRAEGMTLQALRQEVADRLNAEYLVNPQVDISVTDMRSRRVYVLGEVDAPGPLDLDTRMTVWEAVASAGGFTHDANEERVLRMRMDNGRMVAEALDLNQQAEDPAEWVLRDRDILYVPPMRIADFERFMGRIGTIMSAVLGVESSIILGPDVRRAINGDDDEAQVIIPK